jgi:hypothetical protein
MSTLLTMPCEPALDPTFVDKSPVSGEEKVRQQVWGLLAGFHSGSAWTERRSVQRFPLARLIRLTPVGPDGVTPLSGSLVVVGKDVSERGLGFFHLEPLPHRRMIASLETHNGDWIGFLLDISWCRFTHHGWYDSGGRFLQVVEPQGGMFNCKG